jgi:hypothetical protein
LRIRQEEEEAINMRVPTGYSQALMLVVVEVVAAVVLCYRSWGMPEEIIMVKVRVVI